MLNISITEFLTGKIKCLFYEGKNNTEYQETKAPCWNLTEPAGRGNYYHNYIAHYIDSSILFYKQNTPINNDAMKTIEWLRSNFRYQTLEAERTVTSTVVDSQNRIWTITGKPDAYKIENDKLIIIDFKYTDKESSNYIKQVVHYAGMMAGKNECLQEFKLIIKYLNHEKVLELNRDALTTMYEIYKNELIDYIENAIRTPCLKCDKCSHTGCKALLKGVADEIYKAVNKCEDGDLKASDILPVLYPLISLDNTRRDGQTAIEQEKTTQFQSNKEAVRLYKEECNKRNIKATTIIKESVSSNEFRAVMGDEIWQQFCIIKNKPVNDTSKRYCEWE